MKITIVGAGYVGLTTAVSLASLGHTTFCVDRDQDRVLMIKSGRSPFYEPKLDEYLKKFVVGGLLIGTNLIEESVLESSVTIITVETPTVNNKLDLTYIKKASQQIGQALKKIKRYHVVAVKSTVLPGVTEQIVKPILEKYSLKRTGKEFGLCMNPEFLREGSAIEDALHPDRIVIGQHDKRSGAVFAKIYSKVGAPKIFTNLWTAEIIKYAANALFATLISYSNEIARISESTGKIDVVDVWQAVHLDRRLSPVINGDRIKPGILSYIFSGCGFGGSCLPKDTKALTSFAREQDVEAELINSVIRINETQPHRVILLLKKALGNNLKGKKVAVLGLTFKPDTDDFRESPALPIVQELLSQGVNLICHDPMAFKKGVPKQLHDLSGNLVVSVKEALRNADAVVLVTSWEEYVKLTPRFFKRNMKQAIIVDGRRVYDKDSFIKGGVIYKGIGL